MKERAKILMAKKVQSPAEERFPGFDIHFLDAKTKQQNPTGKGHRFSWQEILVLVHAVSSVAVSAMGGGADCSKWKVADDREKDVVVLDSREPGAQVLFLVKRCGAALRPNVGCEAQQGGVVPWQLLLESHCRH